MKKILTSELKPGMAFSQNLFITPDNLLVAAHVPLKPSDLDRLTRWDIKEVLSDGELENQESPVKKLLLTRDIQEIYKNIINNKEKTRQSVLDLLEKTRIVLTKLRTSHDCDDIRIRSIREIIDHELEMRKALLLDSLLMKTNYDYVVRHSLNVTIVSFLLALYMNFPLEKREELVKAALLHNCGMMLLPHDIVYKSGKLTESEMMTIKTHTLLGYKLLYQEVRASPKVCATALQHHEQFGGGGYPRGLQAYEIEEFARIVSIADVYCAMTSDSEYRKKFTTYHAVREILSGSRTKFDPDIVQVFVTGMTLYPIGTFVKLNNNCIGMVVDINEDSKLKPWVTLLVNEFGDKVVDKNIIINLADERKLFINRVLAEDELTIDLKKVL
jgi:HD-GYP domain-containing protein (c-di-GMP phosphodiesterase class II)